VAQGDLKEMFQKL